MFSVVGIPPNGTSQRSHPHQVLLIPECTENCENVFLHSFFPTNTALLNSSWHIYHTTKVPEFCHCSIDGCRCYLQLLTAQHDEAMNPCTCLWLYSWQVPLLAGPSKVELLTKHLQSAEYPPICPPKGSRSFKFSLHRQLWRACFTFLNKPWKTFNLTEKNNPALTVLPLSSTGTWTRMKEAASPGKLSARGEIHFCR